MPATSASGGYLFPSSALPPEDDAFDAIIQSLVVGITAIPGNLVRPRWQPIALPQPEAGINWCAIGVTEEDPQQGRPAITHDGADNGGLGSDTLQVNDEVEVLASFYGPNARSFANLFRDGLMLPQNREALEFPPPSGNAQQIYRIIQMPSPARFVPELVNQTTIRRVDVSFRVKRANVTVWPVENILSVEVELITDRLTEFEIIPVSSENGPSLDFSKAENSQYLGPLIR
jgi:hypothetical protein